MASNEDFMKAVKSRRSYYQLNKDSPISDDRIVELVNEAVLHTPSSFNSQSTRVVVLLNEQHEKLWEEIVKPAVKAVAPPEAFEQTSGKLDSFKAGHGTILFYENPDDVNKLQKQFPLYADKFPEWAEHTNAMHQYVGKFANLCPPPSLPFRPGLLSVAVVMTVNMNMNLWNVG